MALTVSCPSCHKTLRLGEDSQGKKMRCPACQQVFLAPALPANREEPDPPDDSPFSATGNDDPQPAPQRRPLDLEDERPSRRDDYDRPPRRDEDDRPSRRRDCEDDYDRPSRRLRYDDEDERRRSRRRRTDDYDDYPEDGGNGPKVLGILSCVFCLPICYFGGGVGFVLGLIAVIMASSELGSLPRGGRYSALRKNLQLGRTLGITGMSLSVGFFVLLCLAQVFFNAVQMGQF